MPEPWKKYTNPGGPSGPWGKYQDAVSSQPEPSPGLGQRFVSGLTQTPIEQPQGFDIGDIAEFAGSQGLPIAGGFLGASAGPAGAGLGAAAGRASQLAISQGISQARPDLAQERTPGQVLGDVAVTGALDFAGAGIARGLGNALTSIPGRIKSRIVPAMRQAFGVEEEATKRTLQRGASNILKPEIASEDFAINALEKAQGAITNNRAQAGQLIGQAEDLISQSGRGAQQIDVSDIVRKLDSEMASAGLTGKTASLANQKDVSILQSIRDTLTGGRQTLNVQRYDPLTGQITPHTATGNDLIKAKRLIDENLEFGSGKLREAGGNVERIIKSINHDIRQGVNAAYPELAEANTKFAEASGLLDEFRSAIGSRGDVLGDVRTLRRLRTEFFKGGKAQKLLESFDEKIAGAEGSVGQIFDSFSAQSFARNSPSQLSPSSPFFRTLAALGVTSPALGGQAIRGMQAVAPAVGGALRATATGGNLAAPALGPSVEEFVRYLRGGRR